MESVGNPAHRRGSSRASVPDLVWLYDSYHTSGSDILGISLEHRGTNALGSFVGQDKIRYPILIGDRDMVVNYGGIVARDGTIRERWLGTHPRATIEKPSRNS